MKFSIIISCFNNSRFLPSCIKTALRNAENKDVEIICVESVGKAWGQTPLSIR